MSIFFQRIYIGGKIVDFKVIDHYLKEKLNDFRYHHTLRVVSMGEVLGEKFLYSKMDNIKLACYLHDAGKNLGGEKILEIVKAEGYHLNSYEMDNIHIFHGVASMVIARDEFNIKDEEVLNAIKNHVMGIEGMSLLDKIVFLADFFEVGRDSNRVYKSRDAALIEGDINKSLLFAYDSIIGELLSKKLFIHENTLRARNFVLKEIGNCCF